jgi:hypothetical protein
MNYRIETDHNISSTTLRKHLLQLLTDLQDYKIDTVQIVFGFGWGISFNNYRELELELPDVLPMLEFVEKREHGRLGDDDLHIRTQVQGCPVEILFHHHSGIDCNFTGRSLKLVRRLFDEWTQDELHPEAYMKKESKWERASASEIL